MSIICLDLKKALPLTATDAADMIGSAFRVEGFAHGVAHAQALTGRLAHVPQDVLEAVLSVGSDYSIGRCGLRPLTSDWARQHYPEARYELILTLVAHNKRDVHVLIMYYP